MDRRRLILERLLRKYEESAHAKGNAETGRRVQVFAVGLAQAKDYFGISITDGIAQPQYVDVNGIKVSLLPIAIGLPVATAPMGSATIRVG